MLRIVLAICCVYAVLAATTTKKPHHGHSHGANTHPPKVTHEPSESESFTFYYDAHSHIIAARTGKHTCYFYQTSAQEQIDVHSPHDFHAIEKNIIDIIDTNPVGVDITHDDLMALSPKIAGHFCNSHFTTLKKIN